MNHASQNTITKNINSIRQQITEAEKKYARQPGSVQLLAVSKTRPASDIRAACDSGLREFGESYLQEALAKIEELGDLDLTWHFIGPIQSNKTRPISEHFHWVHSIDRAKVARRLSEQRPPELPPLQVCIQVNISAEPSKSGVSPEELPALAELICSLPGLKLRGLMAIPAASDDEAQQRQAFARLRELKSALQNLAPEMDTLSMGMSADLESAIMHGSTMVRIGTDLLGPRPSEAPASDEPTNRGTQSEC